MVGKLDPNPTHSTRGLVKYVPGRDYFRAVPSQNGDKFVTSPPSSIVERVRGGGMITRARTSQIMIEARGETGKSWEALRKILIFISVYKMTGRGNNKEEVNSGRTGAEHVRS